MNKKPGFTMIELLVVIAIMLIFLGLTLAQFNNYNETLKLKSEAKKIVDVIELAKKKALSSDLYNNTCTIFTGYQLNLSTGSYSLSFCCNSVCSSTLKTYSFDTDIANKNISIISPVSGNLIFPPLMSGFNNNIAPTIKLKNNNIGKCVVITISPIGIVNLDETLINC